MHGGCLQAHKRGMLAWSALVGVVDVQSGQCCLLCHLLLQQLE
jgi:hypothetical protein